MRWIPGGQTDDVEDRRGESGSGGGFQVGGIHLRRGGMIVLFVLSLIFKGDFLSLLSTQSVGTTGTAVTERDPARDQREQLLVQFVTFVLNDASANGARSFERKACHTATPSCFEVFRPSDSAKHSLEACRNVHEESIL
jgi:predicted metalloprotease